MKIYSLTFTTCACYRKFLYEFIEFINSTEFVINAAINVVVVAVVGVVVCIDAVLVIMFADASISTKKKPRWKKPWLQPEYIFFKGFLCVELNVPWPSFPYKNNRKSRWLPNLYDNDADEREKESHFLGYSVYCYIVTVKGTRCAAHNSHTQTTYTKTHEYIKNKCGPCLSFCWQWKQSNCILAGIFFIGEIF